MDDILLLQECVFKAEEEEVNAPVAELLQPKVEVEESEEQEVKTESRTSESPVSQQNVSEEELKPVAAMYIKEEVEMDEGTEEQGHLAAHPLAGCEEWGEKNFQPDFLLSRVKQEEADSGTSYERSEEVKVEAEDASGSIRAESPSEGNKGVPTHANKQPFACAHCSEIFRYKKTLKEHQRVHRNEPKLLTCKMCQRQCTSQRALAGHIKVHMNEDEKKAKCADQTCGNQFKGGVSLNTGERPFCCEHCGRTFTHKCHLELHLRRHTGEQPYSCSMCNKRFSQKGNLARHTKFHLNVKPYECKECGKTFGQSNHYTEHLRVHTGEKPFKCSVCSRTFAQKKHLNGHMFTHYRDHNQMTLCEVCGESFKSTYMYVHKRTHTREKPYKCRFCERTFAHSSSRIKHEVTHSERAEVLCEECGKSFLSTEYLRKHIRRHTGEKIHKCDYCGRMFKLLKYLRAHEVTHTKEYPFNCAECGKGYIAKTELAKHILKHGKNPMSSTSGKCSSPDGEFVVMSYKGSL